MTDIRTLLAQAMAAIREIDAATLAAERDQYLLVDVRGPDEVATGMIPDAVHVPVAALVRELGGPHDPAAVEALLSSGTKVCLYCHSGGRSAIAAHALEQAGLKDVVSLAGGIVAWREHAGKI